MKFGHKSSLAPMRIFQFFFGYLCTTIRIKVIITVLQKIRYRKLLVFKL